MHISIHLASLSQKHVISNLLELYSHDFSEISPDKNRFDVNENGRFEYPYLDEYWNENNRFAYLIRIDGKIAGFALVNQNSILQNSNPSFQMAEFFVLRKYRGRGVGINAAKKILYQHPGLWEIPVIRNNLSGFKFWTSLLKQVVKNQYQIIEVSNAKWKGPILSFDITTSVVIVNSAIKSDN